MAEKVYWISAEKLAQRGKEALPGELQSGRHLIYSSPATLAFNSPGAQGFGVKRAGLAIPGSLELLVAPGCCGRNTAALGGFGEYRERFFYLLLDDTDIITGRHLNKITEAVKEITACQKEKPSVVTICITCVDALLGTDMERVCKKAAKKAGVPVIPCYMYALTREGRMPPMTAVRKSLYSLLEKREKKASSVNILGEFAPFMEECELYDLLKQMGLRTIRELSRCRSYAQYQAMAEANFNLVLNPECRVAAADLHERLGIPSIELTRMYQLDKIHRQYELFGAALGKKIEDDAYFAKAQQTVEKFGEKFPGTTFAIGEWMNGNPFELALALLRYGHRVAEIYGTVTKENFIYIKKIAGRSPQTRIYTNLSPTMLYYDCSESRVDLTIGQDAGYYHPDAVNVPWNQERQPFGYAGLSQLFTELLAAAERRTV